MTDLRQVSGGHCCKLCAGRLRRVEGLKEMLGGGGVRMFVGLPKYSLELFNSVIYPTLPLLCLISYDNSPLKYSRLLSQEDPTALPKSSLITY